jgi:hypothetical protein
VPSNRVGSSVTKRLQAGFRVTTTRNLRMRTKDNKMVHCRTIEKVAYGVISFGRSLALVMGATRYQGLVDIVSGSSRIN